MLQNVDAAGVSGIVHGQGVAAWAREGFGQLLVYFVCATACTAGALHADLESTCVVCIEVSLPVKWQPLCTRSRCAPAAACCPACCQRL
jgi:L-alanine-DL-glutamate epimerase-like enolase superfamily enzyme